VIKSRRIRWEVEESLGKLRARWEDNIKMCIAGSRLKVWAG
jgi:hypothetical protein